MIGIEEANGFQQYDGTSVPDAALDSTSTNSVQNKVICDALSHVGMIVQSTTLDTEAKVKAIYGSHTSWIQHSGYILRGASTGVTADQATKDGGEDTHTLTVSEMPKHTHSQIFWAFNGASASGTYYGMGYQTNTGTPVVGTKTGQTLMYNDDTGGDQPHNIMQSYKNVYIWERTA